MTRYKDVLLKEVKLNSYKEKEIGAFDYVIVD